MIGFLPRAMYVPRIEPCLMTGSEGLVLGEGVVTFDAYVILLECLARALLVNFL